ncbi:MAG: glycosyltransferase family 2 protein [Lachnospiraceae bacterium]|nr:glycosyltransferase family 2 protein [Lachnospiraceae bacterium]
MDNSMTGDMEIINDIPGETAILLATYNGEKYLGEQLESLVRQSCSDFVCYIHDDASSDETVRIIEDYCTLYPQMFVFLGSSKCGGAKNNFFYLLKHVKSQYYMFCDQDDYWLEDKVERSLNNLKVLESQYGRNIPLCVYADAIITDENLNMAASSYFRKSRKDAEANSLTELLKTNVAVGCTMAFNRALRDEAIIVQNLDNIFMHDWWCVLLCSLSGKMKCIQEPLSMYRQHGDNTVGLKDRSVSGRLKKVLSWRSWRSYWKMRTERPRRFATELAAIMPKDNVNYDFLEQLALIGEKRKITRIRFYFKNDLFSSTDNKIIQLLFL